MFWKVSGPPLAPMATRPMPGVFKMPCGVIPSPAAVSAAASSVRAMPLVRSARTRSSTPGAAEAKIMLRDISTTPPADFGRSDTRSHVSSESGKGAFSATNCVTAGVTRRGRSR